MNIVRVGGWGLPGLRLFAVVVAFAGQPGGMSRGDDDPAGAPRRVGSARVWILSTMLADMKGVGEWGFSALVEADGRRLLFDTGSRPETVLRNAHDLGLDLSGVT